MTKYKSQYTGHNFDTSVRKALSEFPGQISTLNTKVAALEEDVDDLSALPAQVATIGSKLGDLTQLETEDKTDLVSAINEVKNNMSTTAEDTAYTDNYGIGADNVQDAIDKVGFVGTDTEIDLTQYTEVRAYINPEGKWITTNNTYPYYGIFIPVVPNGKYRITGHLTNNTWYAFLKSNTVGGNNTTVTTFATGCSRVAVSAGQYAVGTAPSDAKFMWVYTTASTTGDRMPQKIESIKESVIEFLSKTESTPTKDSANLVTSGGAYAGIKDAVDGLGLLQEHDEEPILGAWLKTTTGSSFVDDGDHNITITASSSSTCRIGFCITPVGEGKELHISFSYEKTTSKTASFGIGGSMNATWASLVPESGSASIPAALSGDVEFSLIVPSGTKYIYFISSNFYDGGEQTLQITDFRAWTTEKVADATEDELRQEIERSKYSLTDYEDVWSTNDESSITYERTDNGISIHVIKTTQAKRCGFDISEIEVGETVYVDFTSAVGAVFGVGETLASTFVNVGTFKKPFTFTKTSSSQNYLYTPSNSYSAGTIILLEGFKVYRNVYSLGSMADAVDELRDYSFMPSSHIPVKETYERLMYISATDGGQGSTVYGNYFVQGFTYANRVIKIYDLQTQALVQQVALPTFANPRYHANTISFSGTKYDSGDDFPLLYICSGYTDSTEVTTSEVYVVRIVGTAGSYTAELVQTIYLDFGKWTEWVCDPVNNRAWINGSGIDKYICVAIPSISESEVTIDINTAIIDHFNTKTFALGLSDKSSGQGRFFWHNRIYWVSGVPSYTGEGVDALYVCVDNTLTHCTEAVVALKNFGLTGEPEACFIWNDEFYVAYRNLIAKLIQN